MVSSVTSNLLGIGLYTPAQAAMYARVPTALMSRWLFGTKAGGRVVRPQLGETGERWVTFLDFVQALAVRTARQEYKIPLDTIRQAIDEARERYGVEYPFAMRHTTFLYGKEISIRLDDDQYVQVSGKEKHHRMISKLVEVYARDLHYDERGVAASYTAYRWGDVAITLDPKFAFGEPLVRSCGYTAQALWDAVKAEGSVEAVAKVYGVRLDEVEAACRYCDSLGSAAA